MANDLGEQVLRTSLGTYALYAYVASGGSGTVYFGRDLQSNRAVAIKRLHGHLANQPDLVERFEQEAHRLRGLQHPNIVQVLDDGRDSEGLPFIILQWVEGWTVAALLQQQQHGRFAIAEAVQIASQVLAALEAAGQRGVVHRDIKPANLMVTPPPDRQVKVMDFGIAKDLLANASGQYTQIGTIAYMAPEQFTQGRVDARTDVFALGITLYELLTGQRPSGALADESLTSLRELRPEVDPTLAAIVYRALEKRPMDRFQTATQMRAALEPFAGAAVDLTLPDVDTVVLDPVIADLDRTVASEPDGTLAGRRGWRRIGAPIWAGGVATLLALGVVAQQVVSRQTGQDGVSTPTPVAQSTDVARAVAALQAIQSLTVHSRRKRRGNQCWNDAGEKK
jgi:serine/threonine protein kinase